MKRSENVGLVLMGAATFAATFAVGMTYVAWKKPSAAAQQQAQTVSDPACERPDNNQNCQPERRGYAYYLFPSFSGWSWGRGGGSEPRAREVALTNSRSVSVSPAASETVRAGFGSTARKPSIRVSAGG